MGYTISEENSRIAWNIDIDQSCFSYFPGHCVCPFFFFFENQPQIPKKAKPSLRDLMKTIILQGNASTCAASMGNPLCFNSL